MNTTIFELEREVAEQFATIGFPVHELIGENILAAMRLDILTFDNAEQERRILTASIAAGRSGILPKVIGEVA